MNDHGDATTSPGIFEPARAIADAVLYEGYVLYPYRKSSTKNRMRWQFGVLPTREWVEPQGPVADGVAGSTEWWWQQTECLLEAPARATVHVQVRYLQLQARSVEEPDGRGGWAPVERLDVGGRTELSFDEAVPRQLGLELPLGDLAETPVELAFGAPAGEEATEVTDGDRVVGRVVRRRRAVAGSVRVSAAREPSPYELHRLRVHVQNTGAGLPADAPRDEALRHALLATHCLLGADSGGFLSLLEPPEWAAPFARECHNVRTFPVLVGDRRRDGAERLVLSSPIILYDHPRVAPESPGDLHDGGEIDEILTLRTLTLTEDEKREARATDPRTAAIVDRVDAMPPEVMERLHGAIRSLRPTPATDPETAEVLVAGTRVSAGSRVRLHPRRRGSDAHDMFLAGRTATVGQVQTDLDDETWVAVTVDDDPSAELHQWYGRYHYYRPEELEPLAQTAEREPADPVEVRP